MDSGGSISAYSWRNYVLSRLQFILFQRDSQTMWEAPTVEMAGEGCRYIRTTMVYENISIDVGQRCSGGGGSGGHWYTDKQEIRMEDAAAIDAAFP